MNIFQTYMRILIRCTFSLLLVIFATFPITAFAHGDHAPGVVYYDAWVGTYGGGNHGSAVVHGANPQEMCEGVYRSFERFYNGTLKLLNVEVNADMDDEGDTEMFSVDCFFEYEHNDEIKEFVWDGRSFCVVLGTSDPGVCPAEDPVDDTCIGNPIMAASGRKVQREFDWVSPLEPRFRFDRNYASSYASSDRSAHVFGLGWSSSNFVTERDWRVYFGDGNSRALGYTYASWNYWYKPKINDHPYTLAGPNGAPEGVVRVMRDATGNEYRFIELEGRSGLFLGERHWSDGYSISYEYDENYRLAAMEDNRGQRAVFSWLPSVGDGGGDVGGAPPSGGGGPALAPIRPAVERIRIDTDYDGTDLQHDIVIDYDYELSTHWTKYQLYFRGWANTHVEVTDVASGETLKSTRYSYDAEGRGALTGISDGRRDESGDRFDYASFEYERRYIPITEPEDDSDDGTGGAPGDGGGGPMAPTTKYLPRAVTTSHAGGADRTEVGFPNEYGPEFNLTVTNPLGHETVYHFEHINKKDRVVRVDGVATSNCLPSNTSLVYDDDGRVIERIERNGAKTVITRDDVGRILTETEDADGANPRVTTYTWPNYWYAWGNGYINPTWGWRQPLTRTTNELFEEFTYDNDGLLLAYSQTDVLVGSPDNGKTRTWTYSYFKLASGLKVLAYMDGPGLATDGVNDVTTYTYNDRGQLLTTMDSNGLTQEVLSYGITGQPTLIRDHRGFEWALEYDLKGQLLKSTFEPGTLDEETTYSYDIIGQMTSSKDPLDREWIYTYNEARRLVQITAPSGETIEFEHDAMGNVTRTEYSDAAAVMTYLEQTQYDELGRILKAIGSNGQVTDFSHDVEDNLATATDATDLTTTMSYDALNRMTDIVDRANGTTLMEHDTDNQMTSYTDPRGIETGFTYNGFGDLLTEVSADRGTRSYSYNNRGMVTSMTDGRGVITNYTYDDAGLLRSKTFPSNTSLNQSFVYHSSGLNPSIGVLVTPVAATVSSRYTGGPPEMVYDGIFQGNNYVLTQGGAHEFVEVDLGSEQILTKIVVTNRDRTGWRLDNATVVVYDEARNEVYRFAPINKAIDGQVFTFALGGVVSGRYVAVENYDASVQVSEIEVFALPPATPPVDPAPAHNIGSLAYVTDQSGRIDFSNEPTRGTFHEDLRQIGAAQYSTRYTSDAAGQVTQMDYPSGSQLIFDYDDDGDIRGLQWKAYDSVTGTHAAAVDVVGSMTYKPHGPLASLSYGDGGVMTATYDTSYRLTGLKDVRYGTTLRDETYGWTDRDNLETVTDNLNVAQNQDFTYSNREFLASADGAWGELDWLYDSVGNRTQQMSFAGGVTTTDIYTYPTTSNRLDEVVFGGGGLRELSYDDAGNVTFDNRNGPGYGYNYDAAGRMSSFAINGVIQSEYEYNALGQQVVRRLTQEQQTIHSVHDAAGNRIAEYLYDESALTSTLIREYIWADGMIVAVVENGALYYVRTDHIGRPVFATNDAGVKVWEATYLPFGGVHTSSGPNSDLRFPGQWFQAETGLHQNWMRDYDPTLGRYIQADPLGLVDGSSVYGYALQNPGRYVDPTGELIPLLAGSAAASIALGYTIDMIWGDGCYTFEELLLDGGLGVAFGLAGKGLGLGLNALRAARAARAAGSAASKAAVAAPGVRQGLAAVAAAQAARNAASRGATGGMAAAVVSRSGKVYYGLSSQAARRSGIPQQTTNAVRNAAREASKKCGGYAGTCAELDAISRMIAAEGASSTTGAFSAAAQVGTRGGLTTGAFRPACPSCQVVLGDLGIGF